MSHNYRSFVRRARWGRRGQILPLVALSLVVFLGFTGLVIDVGQIYYSYRELQASTDAAALAGAQALPNTTAVAAATNYSAVSGDRNAFGNLPNVTVSAITRCIGSLTGLPCAAPAGANAIQVTQQVSVPLTFMKLFGTGSVPLTATATAAMRGSARAPYNVIILVDGTASMNSADGDASNCGNLSRLTCALTGVQTLLSDLSPCGSSQSSCGSVTKNSSGGGGNVNNAVDRVGLYTFPPVTTASYASDYNCQGSPTTQGYTTPFPSSSTYNIVNFSSDYKSSDTATSLISTSNIVTAVGATSKSKGCLQAKGGFGTYYAQAIYQAQTALAAEQALYPNTQNVLIVLSDGNATATCTKSSGGICTAGDMVGAHTTSTTYPSTLNECHQAIAAAQAATAAGTRVYTVAYGAEASGCTSDSPRITPCTTMQDMATNSSTFFSDYTANGSSGSCVSASRPTTNLNQIFTEIAGDLTVARLIPNNLN